VFLADQRRRPQALSGLFWIDVGDAQLPLWSPNKASDDPVAAERRATAQQRQLEEENRLLYVALTRAEERLYLCGWRGLQTINEPSWHDHVREAAGKLQAKSEPRPASLNRTGGRLGGRNTARQRRRGDRGRGDARHHAGRHRPARLARRADPGSAGPAAAADTVAPERAGPRDLVAARRGPGLALSARARDPSPARDAAAIAGRCTARRGRKPLSRVGRAPCPLPSANRWPAT
jgi:ATP-dependent helicase/nuclease subunit A